MTRLSGKSRVGLTRDRIINAALELFAVQGYGGTPIAEILEHSQANPSSFYYFFRTKDILLLYVLEYYVMRLESMVEHRTAQVADPLEQVFGILDFYRRSLLTTNYACGCLIGKLTLEIPPDQRRIHRALAEALDRLAWVIEKCLKKAEDRFPRDTNFRALAKFILTVMEGGVIQSRASHNINSFDASVSHLDDYFRRLTSDTSGPFPLEEAIPAGNKARV